MTAKTRMTFGEPEDLTRTGDEGRSMRVRFEAVRVPEGSPTRHDLIVRLSGGRAAAWGLDTDRARAVMIHAAVGHILDAARRGELPASDEVLVDDDYAGPMPHHFDRPIRIAGSSIELERDGRTAA